MNRNLETTAEENTWLWKRWNKEITNRCNVVLCTIFLLYLQ